MRAPIRRALYHADVQIDCGPNQQQEKHAWPHERENDRQAHRGADNRKDHVPRAALDRVRLCEPPEVVAGRIPQPSESGLRPFARRHIGRHQIDERFKGLEVCASRRRTETMVEGLLTKSALGTIQHREDVVHEEVVPRAIVYRLTGAISPGARPVVLGDDVHPSHAFARLSPSRPRLVQQARPGAA